MLSSAVSLQKQLVCIRANWRSVAEKKDCGELGFAALNLTYLQ